MSTREICPHGSLRFLSIIVLAFGLACGESEEKLGGLGGGGKADYISSNAREFVLSGQVGLKLPGPFDEISGEALDELSKQRLKVVRRSIQSAIRPVIEEANDGATGDDKRWFVRVKPDAGEVTTPPAVAPDDPMRAVMGFKIEILGSWYLMSKLSPQPEGKWVSHRTFRVEVKDWSEDQGEVIEVEIAGTDSRDAFPKYNEMFADGVYDLAIHFGGDYNEGRHDIDTAEWLVNELLDPEKGWTAPAGVTSFAALTLDSGPFTRKMTIRERMGEDKTVEVKVYIYHSNMVPEDASAEQEQRLSDVMKVSLGGKPGCEGPSCGRDVIIYSGHAGPGAGFILDYQPRHEIKATEFADPDFQMGSKYQIIVNDGCQTWQTYVDALLANANKSCDNLDVMTTINTTPFGAGYQLIWEYIYWLTITDGHGRHYPLSWTSILRGINTRHFRTVHYGVHCIDNNPRLNPHGGADAAQIACRACADDLDCGAGGNLCLGYGLGSACGVACTTDKACPEGYRCGRMADINDFFYVPKQCVRRNYVCPHHQLPQ